MHSHPPVHYFHLLCFTGTLGGKNSVQVALEDDAKGIDDVVIIGYQNATRRTTSAAISSVKGKDIENTPYATFDQMLQGRVAGLKVVVQQLVFLLRFM